VGYVRHNERTIAFLMLIFFIFKNQNDILKLSQLSGTRCTSESAHKIQSEYNNSEKISQLLHITKDFGISSKNYNEKILNVEFEFIISC